MASPVPLVRVVRSGLEEAVHLGHVAVSDASGRVVGAAGDPGAITFARSSMKPLQAAVSLAAIGRELPDRLVAIMCASHNGEEVHVRAVRSLLAEAGLKASSLRCPPDWPLDEPTRRTVRSADRIRHNCSGKHAGMLAACVAAGWDPDRYLERVHPL